MRMKTRGPIFDPQYKRNMSIAFGKAMKKTVLITETNIKKGYKKSPAPNVIGGRKTSHLSRGIRGKISSPHKALIAPGRFVFGRDVPYAGIVEYGRDASNQTVKPRRAKALKFKPRGKTRFIYRKSTQPFRRPLRGNPMFKKTANLLRGSRSPLPKIWTTQVAGAIR